MKRRLGILVLDCLFDFGVAVVYAVFAGMLIVAIVVSDDGPISILRGAVYVSILPAAVLALIVAEVGFRVSRRESNG